MKYPNPESMMSIRCWVERVFMDAKISMLSFIFILIAIAIPSPAYSQISPELYDYLVQDVCMDANGNMIPGDPRTCPARRNILLGEKSPYILTESDTNNPNFQSQGMNSIPVRGTDGTIKILHPKLIQGPFSSNFQMQFYDPSRDGYDFADITNSQYVSFIRTSDGGCLDQLISGSVNYLTAAQRAGGWLIAPFAGTPSNWAPINSINHTTFITRLTPIGMRPKCPFPGTGSGATGVTYWNKPYSFQFNTGVVMTAMVSAHFAATDLSSTNNALERYYFTKEYGYTRWEAWIPQSRCQADAARGATNSILCNPGSPSYASLIGGRCDQNNASSTGVAGLENWGNQNWVRVDCRDLTKFVPLNNPTRLLIDSMANTNNILDINFQETVNSEPLRVWNGNAAQSYHVLGSANGTGWQVNSSAGAGNLTYGPYVTSLPAQSLKARFKLRVDNNTADNKNVALIEVYRNSDNRMFASRIITRKEFLKANTIHEFLLPFNYDGIGALEFRVWVYGNSYVYHDQTTVELR
jgi:hypothetical protein